MHPALPSADDDHRARPVLGGILQGQGQVRRVLVPLAVRVAQAQNVEVPQLLEPRVRAGLASGARTLPGRARPASS